jgi:hypothetical protein
LTGGNDRQETNKSGDGKDVKQGVGDSSCSSSEHAAGDDSEQHDAE